MILPITVPCYECGKPSTEEHHIVPQCKGGTVTVSLCWQCHRRAHHASFDDLSKAKRPIPAFGYRHEGAQLVIDHTEQRVLATIKRFHREGRTRADCIDELNTFSKTRGKAPWAKHSFQTLNKKALGGLDFRKAGSQQGAKRWHLSDEIVEEILRQYEHRSTTNGCRQVAQRLGLHYSAVLRVVRAAETTKVASKSKRIDLVGGCLRGIRKNGNTWYWLIEPTNTGKRGAPSPKRTGVSRMTEEQAQEYAKGVLGSKVPGPRTVQPHSRASSTKNGG